MSDQPDGIVAFLEARYAEREAAATAATPGPWRWIDPGGRRVKQALVADGHPWQMVLPSATSDVYPQVGDAAHIALNDPAYVLADIAAKRQILDLHDMDEMACCAVCHNEVHYPCRTLQLLAQPFEAHPDYRAEWRPA